MSDDIYMILLSIIPGLFAITVHEYAHGWMAKRYGDSTAFLQGRLTLNPMSHIDPIGTVLVPLVCMLTTGFIVGWAKPVPVNFSRLEKRRLHGILVSFAGPLSNFLMALAWLTLMFILSLLSSSVHLDLIKGLLLMAGLGISFNISFMIFNLLPILPLDGGRILADLLPGKLAVHYAKSEPYGIYIVILLSLTGILGMFLIPLNKYIFASMTQLLNIFA